MPNDIKFNNLSVQLNLDDILKGNNPVVELYEDLSPRRYVMELFKYKFYYNNELLRDQDYKRLLSYIKYSGAININKTPVSSVQKFAGKFNQQNREYDFILTEMKGKDMNVCAIEWNEGKPIDPKYCEKNIINYFKNSEQ